MGQLVSESAMLVNSCFAGLLLQTQFSHHDLTSFEHSPKWSLTCRGLGTGRLSDQDKVLLLVRCCAPPARLAGILEEPQNTE